VFPQGIPAVITFFLFVAPGITWELMGERSRPTVTSTPFREAARVALTSVVFSGAALLALAVTRSRWPRTMPDPRLWLSASGYAQRHYRLVARTIALEVGIACGLAAVIQLLRGIGKKQRVVQRPTLWTVLHTSGADKQDIPMAIVRLADGTVYAGDVAHEGYFETRADDDIVLQRASVTRGGTVSRVEAPWARVILPMTNVNELWVGWRKPPRSERRRRRWLWRV
jgi:hypothetical protein